MMTKMGILLVRVLPLLSLSTCAVAHTVVIIGGGMGGMALAGQLAVSGKKVTLLEKNNGV